MSDVDDIRRQMAQIRHEMHYNVANVVSDVEDAMDWRSIIRRHPYLSIGAGLAAGFLLVPRRQTRAQRVKQVLAELPPQALADVIPRATAPPPPKAPPKSLSRQAAGWALGMLWPMVGQSVQAYAAMWLEDQIKQHLNPHPGSPGGRPSPPSSGTGRTAEPYDGEASPRNTRRG